LTSFAVDLIPLVGRTGSRGSEHYPADYITKCRVVIDATDAPPFVLPRVAARLRVRRQPRVAGADSLDHLPHQYLADEKTSERDLIDRQLRTREPWMATLMSARFQRIRSTHCAREGPGSNGSPKYWVSRATFPSLNSMMLTV